MTQYLSDKIKLLSFILILFVLYIHSSFHSDEIHGMYWNDFIQEFISGKIGRLAVPLFYILSGYLFFRNTENGLTSIYTKIRKRINSLLIPYILACLFFVLFAITVNTNPIINHYMNGSILPLFKKTIPEILKSIFWSSESGTPMAFQLWFLRDLIVIVAISPIIYFVIKYFRWWASCLFFCLSFVTVIEPISLFSSIFWFVLGATLTFTNTPIEFNKTKWGWIILLIYLTISLFEQIYSWFYFSYLQNFLILTGILALWLCYDNIVGQKFSLKENKWLSIICSFTFFIYLFHEPTINIVRKLIVILLGQNSVGYLISYLTSPFIFILLAIVIGIFLKKRIPNFYSILVGGR